MFYNADERQTSAKKERGRKCDVVGRARVLLLIRAHLKVNPLLYRDRVIASRAAAVATSAVVMVMPDALA